MNALSIHAYGRGWFSWGGRSCRAAARRRPVGGCWGQHLDEAPLVAQIGLEPHRIGCWVWIPASPEPDLAEEVPRNEPMCFGGPPSSGCLRRSAVRLHDPQPDPD